MLRICLLCVFALSTDLSMAAAQISVSVKDSMEKFRQDQPITADVNPVINLASARNESETAQLLLSAPSDINNVEVTVSALAHSSDRRALIDGGQAFWVHYPIIEMPTKESGAAGPWPDGLIPLTRPFGVKSGKQQAIWLKFAVDKNAKPGLYEGNVSVSQQGKLLITVPVKMTVWNVTLPDQVHLPSVIGLDYGSISKVEGGPAKIESYYKALTEQRAVPIDLYNSNPVYAIRNGQSEVDFTPFRRQYDAAYRFSAPFMIPFSMNWPVNTATYPLFSEEYNQLAVDYLKKTAAYLAGQGLIDQAYVYVGEIDEPKSAEQYAVVEGFATILKVADPRLKLLLTIHAECPDCGGKTIAKLDQDNILWAPNIAYYDNQAMKLETGLLGLVPNVSSVPSGWDVRFKERLTSSQRPFWWYLNPWTFVSRDVNDNYPNVYIDSPGIGQRIIGWLAFAHDVKAIGFWNATYWQTTADPWRSVPRGEEASSIAGDGSMFYPIRGSDAFGQSQVESPVASIRLELMRESSEDYELLYMLKAKGKSQVASAIAFKAGTGLQNHIADPAQLKQLREEAAKALMTP